MVVRELKHQPDLVDSGLRDVVRVWLVVEVLMLIWALGLDQEFPFLCIYISNYLY